MSSPNLTVGVEPLEAGSVVYLSLAPSTANGSPSGQVALKLALMNNEAKQVQVNKLAISFIGSPNVNGSTIAMDLNIPAGKLANWFFQPANNITVPVPAPGQIRISLSCTGYSDPVVVTLPLKPHLSPVAGGSYNFPAKAGDLRIGEYWTGKSESHASAGDGGQLFAYDMGVMAFDTATKQWSQTLPGKDGSKNDHYRIWGKPIYAAADGTVVDFKNDMPSNEKMGTQTPTPNPVEGNHFYLQHGDELMLYAHMQPGSLNAKLMVKGATVKQGDFLGLAGNSGNSTNPHLHVHTIQATQPWAGPLRPLPFRNLYVIDRSALTPPNPDGPWVKAEDQGLPNVAAAIWPAATKPAWYPPGWAELARHGVPESSYQNEFDHIVSSGYRLVWIDGYDVNGKTFFNVIFRPADGTPWVARHGLDGTQYQQEFDHWTQQGYRLAHIESYLSNGHVRYAPIFVKSAGPAWVAYHGRSADQHQQQFDQLTADGFRPVNVAAVSPSGIRTYAALYEKRDVGSFFLKSFMTPSEYQTQFDDNVHAGRKLVYLNAYTHQGTPRIVAIWNEHGATPFMARHGLSSAQYQVEFDKHLAEGFLSRAVTGYEEGDQARFAALWSK